jgi:hypothetical protein
VGIGGIQYQKTYNITRWTYSRPLSFKNSQEHKKKSLPWVAFIQISNTKTFKPNTTSRVIIGTELPNYFLTTSQILLASPKKYGNSNRRHSTHHFRFRIAPPTTATTSSLVASADRRRIHK